MPISNKKSESKFFIGSDHGGFELKEIIKKFLADSGYEFEDVGPYKYDKDDDYPDYALKVCEKVLKTNGRGILICTTGQGMVSTANKIPGIRAALCWNEEVARQASEHLNSNVITLGSKFTTPDAAKKIVKAWLENKFSGEERHVRRNNKIKKIEEKYLK
jgi:ribose 5-phosphate isomerase B